ncbi:Uncharacterized protein conserved in bacteria [uncultured Clostridium sp.]|nr:Uncharacterized protein conserved in bacteria [uncultured Clostridium sp.]
MKEGDRKTPAGVFGFTKAFGIKDNPGAKLPYTKLNPYLYWCGDKQWYNTLVDVRETPHECSGEHLISYVPHYNYVLAIDYNPECTFGKGSYSENKSRTKGKRLAFGMRKLRISDVEISQKGRLQRQVVLGHGRTLKKGGSSPFFRCFDNLVAQ